MCIGFARVAGCVCGLYQACHPATLDAVAVTIPLFLAVLLTLNPVARYKKKNRHGAYNYHYPASLSICLVEKIQMFVTRV
jgi:hypothetical protein